MTICLLLLDIYRVLSKETGKKILVIKFIIEHSNLFAFAGNMNFRVSVGKVSIGKLDPEMKFLHGPVHTK